MNKLVIYCAGGLCNRLAAIYNGLYFAEKTFREPIINWPLENHCEIPIKDLFELKIKTYSYTLKEIVKNTKADFYFNNTYNIKEIENNNYKISIEKNNSEIVLYSDCLVIDQLKNTGFVNNLQIKRFILNEVNSFIEKNEITEKTTGIHARLTDFSSKINKQEIETLINESENKVFLCSDDEDYEKYISSKFSKVIMNTKKSYTRKYVDGPWVRNVITKTGLQGKSNTHRDSQSILDAFKDLLILSRTNLKYGLPSSTFYQFAKFYKKYNILFP